MTCEFGISDHYKFVSRIIIPESVLRSFQIRLIIRLLIYTYNAHNEMFRKQLFRLMIILSQLFKI